jgi:hypothetical protein
MQKEFEGHLVVFKIFLSDKNCPSSHIELTGTEFTHYSAEEETLLAPFFTF